MKYSPQQYAHALHDLAKDTAPAKRRGMIREFLGAVSKNGSLSALPDIIREYELLSDKRAKLHHITVRTPERLSERGIARKLYFRARIRAERDARLRGGVVVEVDDIRVDNSIKMRMGRVREALTK